MADNTGTVISFRKPTVSFQILATLEPSALTDDASDEAAKMLLPTVLFLLKETTGNHNRLRLSAQTLASRPRKRQRKTVFTINL